MDTNEEYEFHFDVVFHVLTEHSRILWDMSKNKEEWGIMDHIRMDQIHQINQCIKLWKEHKKNEQAD